MENSMGAVSLELEQMHSSAVQACKLMFQCHMIVTSTANVACAART